ncbi:MAG: hypothetical protein GY854_07895 [Deltaproteobacteria bacterium]|nr:hypothetical protein [Deltaproteobacteria bacterium]
MTENQDPIACSSCGTVNPWMNEQCRDCGAELSRDLAAQKQSDSEAPGVSTAAPEIETEKKSPARHGVKAKRRLNFLWVIIGGLLYVMAISICDGIIQGWIIPQYPELQALIQEVDAADRSKPIPESDKERFRAVLFSNTSFVGSVIFVTIFVPLLVGLLVGFFSGGIREGAISLGSGVLIVLLINGQYDPILLVISSLLVGGLGTLGALAGYKLAIRLKRV